LPSISMSLPIRGAWIEIVYKKEKSKLYNVAPYTGSVD
jgi:hypothetical protein